MWLEDKNWTDEEKRIKRPFVRFWVPVIFFLFVWWIVMLVFDLMKIL